jgi:hypothetical protein
MATLLKSLMKQLGPAGISQISNMLGQDKKTTGRALETILPSIINGLSRNASHSDGAESLTKALEKDHDGGILDDILGFLGQGDESEGQGILGHIFGEKKEKVETGLSRTTGLDLNSIVKLMGIAAPLVMGLLGKTRRENEMGADNISQLLQKENRKLGRRTQKKISPVLQILDSNADGDVTDDLINLGSGLLSRLFKRR